MFNKILVPIDGPELARSILAHVKRLLRREDSEVVLLHVVAPSGSSELDPEPAKHVRLRLDHAQRLLEELKDDLYGEGIQASCHVQLGDPAGVILSEAESQGASLVALATHGRWGPSRWILGSVTERVLRRSPVPTLTCTAAKGEPKDGVRFRKVLVPLDGSEASASVLPLVATFAKLHESEVVLLRVGRAIEAPMEYPLAEVMTPPDPRVLEASLVPHQETLQRSGVARVSKRVLLAANEALAILEVTEEEGVDLVAMSTHGRTGLERWLYGSVAEKVLRHCKKPLLLNRVHSA